MTDAGKFDWEEFSAAFLPGQRQHELEGPTLNGASPRVADADQGGASEAERSALTKEWGDAGNPEDEWDASGR